MHQSYHHIYEYIHVFPVVRTKLSWIHTFITGTKSNYRGHSLGISLISCGDWVNWKSFVNFNFPVLCLYYLLLEFSVGPRTTSGALRRFIAGIHYSYLLQKAECRRLKNFYGVVNYLLPPKLNQFRLGEVRNNKQLFINYFSSRQ